MTAPPRLSEPPIFIFGSGRSGTTLLQSLLTRHSRIAIAPETQFCRRSEDIAGVPIDRDPPDFDAYWTAYTATAPFRDLGISPEACRDRILAAGRPGFRATLTAMLAAFGERAQKPRIGEKTPRHMHYARTLLDWFPDARMIALQRDPRAVIASELRTPWRRRDLDLHAPAIGALTRLHVTARCARAWARINGRLLPGLARDPRIRILRYETLVTDTEAALKDLCAFLGESFEPAMLSGGAQVSATAARGSAEWNDWMRAHTSRAHGTVTADSVTKWRKDLSPGEIAVIEAIAAPAMMRAGYGDATSTRSGRGAAMTRARLAETVFRAERPARHLVRHLRARLTGGA